MTPLRTVDLSTFARFLGLSMISQGISVSPLKLQKLLYYQQAWHMVFFGRENQLFNESPEAWVNGPVYPAIYHQYKECVPGMCDHLRPEHFGVPTDGVLDELARLDASMGLQEEELRLFQSVMALYGAKTQNQLILVTHAEKPWCDAREGLLPYQSSDRKISLDTMYSYYKERHDRIRGRK
jgi:uncharacterized phage-associated protein